MKTYSKKVLELDSENIKASYRLCLANIKLGHLKKADHLLEDLEKKIGGSPELEELEKIYSINKTNAEAKFHFRVCFFEIDASRLPCGVVKAGFKKSSFS